MKRSLITAAGLALMAATLILADERGEQVRQDRTEVKATGEWIYNHLNKGIDEAREAGKPLLVIFRCVP